jgi:SsrA-binding protein
MLTKQDLPERKYHLITSNKKAFFDYEVSQTMEAGIVLSGTEVKSLRKGKCNLQDSFAGFKSKNNDDLFLFNVSISEYDFGNRENHEAKRPRKLLLHKKELIKWRTQVVEKGMSIVPLKIYFSGHLVKVEIALAKPKKNYDKREATKEREGKREVQRSLKS